jgi:TPR repeat protein
VFVDERANIPPDIVSNAREGDAAAQLVMGKFYFETASIENNRRIAFEWITLSAKQGNMEAQFRLADLYILGQGTSKCFSDAYQWYTKAAIQGYKKALIRLHNLYHDDIKMHCRGQIDANKPQHLAKPGRLQRFETVLNCTIGYYTGQFKHYQSSKQGDCGVQLNLAFLYQHGYGVKKCIKWAFEYYTKAAEQGSTDAQYNLGYLFQKHTNIKFNYRQAFKWFTQSAQGGNIAAQRSLGYFCLKGLATDIDYDVALFWYNKAAEAGDSGAQVTLGKLYRKGDCVKQDLSMAVEWYSLAARQGNIVAQNCLSQLHQRGRLNDITPEQEISEYVTEESMKSKLCTKLSIDVSERDDSPNFKQLTELARCALIGDGRAMYEIGLKYLKGDGDFTQDQDTGAKWIKNAANAKYKLAQSIIADLYNKGDSIEQDYFKATIWYKTLAKKKDSTAQCNVGMMYNKGHGVREDSLEASKWFTWATDQGNNDAQFNLGMLRLKGRGLRKDNKEAIEWLFKSMYQKNNHACCTVGDIYLKGKNGEEKSVEKGLKLLEFAAKNGSVTAQVELGGLYSNTENEYHDLSKSIIYYFMAVDSGDITAPYTLATIYLYGNSTPKDYIKIYSLFKQSKDKGMLSAQGVFKTPISVLSSIKDYSEILDMFIEVTNRDIADFDYNIGSLYEHGVQRYRTSIFDTNYTSAIELYQSASNKGDSRADYRLGMMHECGKHFERNIVIAIKYYNIASINGNTDASYRIACIYVNGCGVTQDLLRA